VPSSKRNANEWYALISDAITTSDPFLSNFKITRIHHLLSQALLDAVGPEAGANFHSWAVWGSRKAGVTIRQEDKDQASRDATIVAGIVGALVGVAVGWGMASWMNWSLVGSLAAWISIGLVTGGYCGYRLAGYTRSSAARIILKGNRIVLDDIGRESARYLDYVGKLVPGENSERLFAEFVAGFRPGPTEENGQDLLRRAFELYEAARRSDDPKTQHECNYFANCLAVLHEHIRLQPYINQSLPFLIRKCVTQRLMTYSVGEKTLAVHEAVPPLGADNFPPTLVQIDSAELEEFLHGPDGWDRARGRLQDTKANDWTKIRERMGYIVNLFRTRHLATEVMASPYSAEQLEWIGNGNRPGRPW